MRLIIGVLLLVLTARQVSTTTPLPVTVELRRAVAVRTTEVLRDGTSHQVRGVLYADTVMSLRVGERLTMVAVGTEGGCRVRIRGRELAVRSCPWLEGFTDHQADIFRVRRARTPPRGSAAAMRRPL